MTRGPDFTNLGQIAQRRAAYDTDNMPTQVWAQQSGVTTYFSYDGDGDRVKKTTPGGATTYYVGDHYEVKNDESLKYLFAGNLRLIMIKGTNTFYFHKDHLGSTSVMTNNSGGVEETTQYEPFGSTREHTGTDMSGYKFTDQELDNETNLYNYDARLYDPVIGRFGTADSIIQNTYDPQKLNPYSYCRNNPLIYTDPTGHMIPDDSLSGGELEGSHSYIGDYNFDRPETLWDKAVMGGVQYSFGLISAPLAPVAGVGSGLIELSEGNISAGQFFGDLGYGILTSPITVAEDLLSGDPLRMGRGTAGAFGFAALGKAAASKIGNSLATKNGLTSLNTAEVALGEELFQLSGQSSKTLSDVSVAIGATNIRTGQATVGRAIRGVTGCAEMDAAAQLGGNVSDIRFTMPVRPRTGQIVPVCTNCQSIFKKTQFPSGTPFK